MTTMHIRNHVVVGTDGSDSATRAVRWAAREAALRHLPLRVVHGFVWPLVHAPLGGAGYLEHGEGLRATAQQILADAADAARTAEPGVPVETSLIDESGTVALLRAGWDAALVVVGSRGLGGFSQEEETRLLAELLAGYCEKYPDVAVTREVVQGRPHRVLVEASREAQLLVVGARGVGGFRGLLFGSVSQAVLHHAHCPVAVVRAEARVGDGSARLLG